MAKKSNESSPKLRVALSPEAREKQMIALAEDLAEKQLLEGTASSQVIVHYLKLGSGRESLERDKLKSENELLKAKVTQLENMEDTAEKYDNAIKAMSIYTGNGDEEDYEDY